MTHTAIFDTLAFAKKLESKGVPPSQAEAHAEYLKEVLENTITPVTNEQQTYNTEIVKLDSKIDHLASEIKQGFTQVNENIAKLEVRILKWMIGLMIAFAGFIYTAIKYIH